MTLLRLLQCCHFDLFVYHVMCLLEILCLTVSASLSSVHSASSVVHALLW